MHARLCVCVCVCVCRQHKGEYVGGDTIYKDLRERGYVETLSFSLPSESVNQEKRIASFAGPRTEHTGDIISVSNFQNLCR